MKLVFDLAIAAMLVLLLVPLFVVVSALIVLESRGPVFYRARRVGRGGQHFDVLKFRKMHDGVNGLPLTIDGDARFTRIGGFLARTRIDELPQLINILRGEMSLVGPRPEDPRFVSLHPDMFAEILSVRPGITGWSQLAFAEEPSILRPEDPIGHYVEAILPQKIRLDVKYARGHRLIDDLRVLAWTAATVIMRVPVAVDRKTGRLGVRRRPARAVQPALAPAAQLATAEAVAGGGAREGRFSRAGSPARIGMSASAAVIDDASEPGDRQVAGIGG